MSNNIEEDIKKVEEKIKALDKHISNYEKAECKTAVYQELVKERDAILNVVNQVHKDKKTLDLVNEMKRKYKIALFMVIRNSSVLPNGLALRKTEKEINKMSYETLCEVLLSINFKVAEKMYEEGKEMHENG